MPEDSQVCPQCATPVQAAPAPPTQASQPSQPASVPTSAWLNVPPAQQQYPPQGQYPPQAQAYRGQYPQQTETNAIVSMILGILSFALCLSFLTGIPAIILGHISRSKIAKSAGRLKGDGMALTGLILGYCSLPFILIIMAVTIPNLLRARISANEAAAASTVRTINTAQVTYQTTYTNRGYAADLATLGSCNGSPTADHACLIDTDLGRAHCTSGVWCQKGQFKYTMVANCAAANSPTQENPGECKDYVVVATPLSSAMGQHSYCSTTDAVVRKHSGGPLTSLPTPEECGEWEDL